jgi:hypothetical protein
VPDWSKFNASVSPCGHEDFPFSCFSFVFSFMMESTFAWNCPSQSSRKEGTAPCGIFFSLLLFAVSLFMHLEIFIGFRAYPWNKTFFLYLYFCLL